jgi:hypothetical protein
MTSLAPHAKVPQLVDRLEEGPDRMSVGIWVKPELAKTRLKTKNPARPRQCGGSAKRSGASPAHGHRMHELGSIDVMRLDQTLGQSRHVACASSCMSMRTCLEEGIKPHRLAGIFPE